MIDTIVPERPTVLPHVEASIRDGIRAYLHQKSFLGGIPLEVLGRNFPGVPEVMILKAIERLADDGIVRIAGDACGVCVHYVQIGGPAR